MSNCNKMRVENRLWSDLPPELVLQIAERLGPIELLNFHNVCKAWNSASSTSLAQTISSHKPWFLLYGEEENYTDKCQLLICELATEKYTIRIPELKEATCLASDEGWLLLFKRGGSMSFFCPFSRAKIDLPKLPVSRLSNHVAAFSSPPTSQDCIVSVIHHKNCQELELHVLRRGTNEWIRHNYKTPVSVLWIECAAFHNGEFHFFTRGHIEKMLMTVTVADNNVQCQWFDIVIASTPPAGDKETLAHEDDGIDLEFIPDRNYMAKRHVTKRLRLGSDPSISTCGTKIRRMDGGMDSVIFNTGIVISDDICSRRPYYKGVWIHPRFHQISPNNKSW